MEIYKEDVPVSLHNLIDIIGMDKFVEVARFYGGANLYIPMYKNLMIYDRNRKIVKEYNGKNGEIIRKKYDLSYAQMRHLLKGK